MLFLVWQSSARLEMKSSFGSFTSGESIVSFLYPTPSRFPVSQALSTLQKPDLPGISCSKVSGRQRVEIFDALFT